MNCVSCDIHYACTYVPPWVFVFFRREFISSRVTEACSVTTDLIMRVNVRTTTTTTCTLVQRAKLHNSTLSSSSSIIILLCVCSSVIGGGAWLKTTPGPVKNNHQGSPTKPHLHRGVSFVCCGWKGSTTTRPIRSRTTARERARGE